MNDQDDEMNTMAGEIVTENGEMDMDAVNEILESSAEAVIKKEDIEKQRDILRRQKDGLAGIVTQITDRVAMIERELLALDAYERTLRGETLMPKRGGAMTQGGTRRTGIRREVLDMIKASNGGISRREIIDRMGAKGDKRAEQSISNALTNLKKSGQIDNEGGVYSGT